MEEVGPKAEEQPSWPQVLAPVVLGAGAILTVVSAPMVAFISTGGYGDCATACDASAAWNEVGRSQAWLLWTWPVVAAALALLARRWPAAWLPFVAVAGAILGLGLVVYLNGQWNPAPELVGIPLPAITPGFYVWSAAALTLTLGGVQAYLASRMRR